MRFSFSGKNQLLPDCFLLLYHIFFPEPNKRPSLLLNENVDSLHAMTKNKIRSKLQKESRGEFSV